MPEPLYITRMMEKVLSVGDHWLFFGAWSGGYGMIRHSHKKRSYLAHRASNEYFRAALSDSEVLDHMCRIRCCINPDHLDVVTSEINTMRRGGLSDEFRCVRGHTKAPENIATYIRSNGSERAVCKPCRSEYGKEYRARFQ